MSREKKMDKKTTFNEEIKSVYVTSFQCIYDIAGYEDLQKQVFRFTWCTKSIMEGSPTASSTNICDISILYCTYFNIPCLDFFRKKLYTLKV